MFITIFAFVIVLAVLVLAHELGHFWVAKKSGMIVEEFGFGFPPRIMSWKKGETKYSINLFPLGGFVKIEGEDGEESTDPRSFVNKSAWQRFMVLVAGVVMNFVLAIVLLSVVASLGSTEEITEANQDLAKNSRVMFIEIDKDTPAAEAELLAGDVVLKFAGQAITEPKILQNLSKIKAGQATNMLIKRGSETIAVSITPRSNPPENQGPLGVVLVYVGDVKYPIHKAIAQGFVRTYETTVLIGDTLGDLIGSLISEGKAPYEISGPVGVAVFSGRVARLGVVALLNFMAILSVNLGLLNILPLPALDGGRILFLIIEKLRGKKGQKAERISNIIGFALLIGLMVVVSIKDVIQFDVLGKIKGLF